MVSNLWLKISNAQVINGCHFHIFQYCHMGKMCHESEIQGSSRENYRTLTLSVKGSNIEIKLVKITLKLAIVILIETLLERIKYFFIKNTI